MSILAGRQLVLREIDVPQRRISEAGAPPAGLTAAPSFAPLAARLPAGRIWHVNSTATGGGVAEMLPSLVGYARALGIDMRWLVLGGSAEFFAVTKRLHHALHGSAGDGGPLDGRARETYERSLKPVADALSATLAPGDAVMLHDPQTAGLAPALVAAGHRVVWRCHVGDDAVNEEVGAAWAFLRGYLDGVDAYVFSRHGYIPRELDARRAVVVPPSIDPDSPKNEALGDDVVRAVLVQAGLVAGRRHRRPVSVGASDGTPRTVRRRAQVVRERDLPAWETPLVVQISRWDPLKDFAGVMRGFARLSAEGDVPREARLVLAGPSTSSVADDPEAAATFAAIEREWRALPRAVRAQVYLVQLPTEDIVENATVVNALQRHAAVVIQKSLREGFGLTVTEAMWKARPVLASAVGGIQDQIVDGVSGVLLPDPRDIEAFAGALGALLEEPGRAARLGREARGTVRERYLSLRHLRQYVELFAALCQPKAA